MANLTDNPNGINQEELAKELQRLRDVEGVTFAAIANKTGISRSAISQLVNQGLRVKSEHAQKLLDAVNEGTNITVVISDNLTTGMTGGQDSAGTGRLEQICAGLGVEPEHIRVVVPLPKNMEEIRRTIREEIEYKGVSVIIPRRECIQTAKRHNAKKQ